MIRMLKRWRKRLRALVRTEEVDRELDEELAFHLEMETEKHVRAGLSPEEARRKARLAFGAVRKHKAETRNARWMSWVPGMSLDLKLGARMLRKYPGLTLVGGLAMAFGIWIGATTFELVRLVVFPSLTLPGGDRIVQVRLWDAEASRTEPRALHDYQVWRETARSVTDLGAFVDVTRNVLADDGESRPVAAAEITASASRIATDAPLLGRTLVATDEAPGAPPVAVLGYDLWRTRFGSRPDIIGRNIRIGETFATVVGVMPEGYAFPVAHELWMPFKPEVADQAPREGPAITVFGRLAPGVTIDAARAELASLGRRTAAELPATHAHLLPQVRPYARLMLDPRPSDMWLMLAIPLFAVMLLVLVCSNVALLMFARAATRESELVVRSALGASRGRIVAQLFAEALVLGGVAAVLGLAAARFALDRWGHRYLADNLGQLPFWYDVHLSATTVLYALGLTVLGAAIAGVLPGLKVTHGLGTRLRNGTAGAGLRFGGVWTIVIIAQVAVTAAFPAVAYIEQRELWRAESYDVGFHADQYLGVQLRLDATASGVSVEQADSAQHARFGAALEELRRRLTAEPGVTGVTFVDELPRMPHADGHIEVEDASVVQAPAGIATSPTLRDSLRWVGVASIDPSYFDVLEAPMLAGRAFHGDDATSDARVAIVDEVFVKQILHGRNAVGRRIRFYETLGRGADAKEVPGPWVQIVGVAKDLGITSLTSRTRDAGVYLPVRLASSGPLYMAVHARGDPMSLIPRVRAIAMAVDPALRLSELQRLNEASSGVLWFLKLWIRITVVLTAIALLLSLAGIYAVMSFTVARRTREIGIRVALGANSRRMVASIFKRPLMQVSIGVALGSVLAGLLLVGTEMGGGTVSPTGVGLMVLYAFVILGVCLLACVVPTRRALAVEPMEALRAE
jgi:putative ABC transport system permease protein